MPQGPSCPAVQYVLPLHGGGTQRRALSWALLTPLEPDRPAAAASERPLLQQDLPSPAWPTSAGEYDALRPQGEG